MKIVQGALVLVLLLANFGELVAEEKDLLLKPEETLKGFVAKALPASRYAVVIGINEYQDPSIPDLNYARSDAEALYQLLIDPTIGGFSQDQVLLLLDEQATFMEMRYALREWLFQQATSEDAFVLIFFSGHGAPEPRQSGSGFDAYLVAHDTQRDRIRSTGFPMSELKRVFDLPSKQVVMLVDSCYSGTGGKSILRDGMRPGLVSGIDEEIMQLGGEGRVIISSATESQISLELEDVKHGVFTYYLLEALKGAADTKADALRGYITLDEAWDYLKTKVPETARQKGVEQTPMRSGVETGDVVLAANIPQVLQSKLLDAYKEGKLTGREYERGRYLLEHEDELEAEEMAAFRALSDYLAGDIGVETLREIWGTTSHRPPRAQPSPPVESPPPKEETVTQQPPQTRPSPPIPSVKTSGALSVISQPPGANIFLDGQPTPLNTPALIEPLVPGNHDLRLIKETFEAWQQRVLIEAGKTAQVSATLKPLVAMPPQEPSPPQEPQMMSGRHLKWWMIGGGGVAIAATAVAVKLLLSDDSGGSDTASLKIHVSLP